MKILAFVDTHGSIKAIKKIADKAKKEKPDLLICAGDVSMFQHGLDYLIYKTSEIGVQTLVVHGNHETEEGLKKSCSLFKNTVCVHNKSFNKNGYLFIGYGGGGFSVKDDKFTRAMKRFSGKIKRNNEPIEGLSYDDFIKDYLNKNDHQF